jgi:hypothetical protein
LIFNSRKGKIVSEYEVYWGEAHDNTYQFASMPVSIEEVFRRAMSHLDFYAAAYYTAFAGAFIEGGHLSETEKPYGLILEGWKDQKRLDREWSEVQEVSKSMNRAGEFVTFPGYEWQGDGSSGDHNVYSRREGLPIFRVNTIAELYECLKGNEAIAIPHHTAYRPGRRGRDWSVFDEALSPFAELYSIHGCSETDEELIGLRQNSHMGPGQGGGTYQDALDRGYHLGAVCSTDNWGDMPGHYGNGRMACLAKELSREKLWEAFKARRIYGVTGDRILVDFRINDGIMGSIIRSRGKRVIQVRVVGSEALDRIEILKNGRVFETHCHQGRWGLPKPGQRTRFKIRVEVGWGPRPNELEVPDRKWHGELTLSRGSIVGYEPCWISPGHGRPRWQDGRVTFDMVSSSKNLKERVQNSNVFEFESEINTTLTLNINGLVVKAKVADLAAGSRILWYKDECIKMLESLAGLRPGSPEREDIYYIMAYLAKIHRVIPEAGYRVELEIEDDEPLKDETNYRIRVEQRNGQRAWSSPIWVQP